MSKNYDIIEHLIEHLATIHIEAKNKLDAHENILESALMEAKIQGILHAGAYILNSKEKSDIWNKYGHAYSTKISDIAIRLMSGYRELESVVCDLENEMESRDVDSNADDVDFWSNMTDEEQRIWKDAEDWETSLLLEKFRK